MKGKCTECDQEKETTEMLWDWKEEVWLCKACYIGGLLKGLDENKIFSIPKQSHYMAEAAAQQLGSRLFNATFKEQLKAGKRPDAPKPEKA